MKRQAKKLDDQLVTRGMLKGILSRGFKKHRLEWKSELQKEMHALEYRLNASMDAKIDGKIAILLDIKLQEKFDQTINPLVKEMREYRETFQKLADKKL